MEIDNKTKKRLLIIGAIILISFIAFVFVMVKMIKENGECVDDPFGYSAQKLEDSGGNYLCSCKSLDPELLDFTFNKEGIKIITEDNNYFDISNIDFSEIEVKGGNE